MRATADVQFHGTYFLASDPQIPPKERVHMVTCEIWQLTGYRFT
jgi:hypothetical protein